MDKEAKVNCLGCGKSILRYGFYNKGCRRWSRVSKYCSNKCVGIGNSKYRIGENSSGWKGGVLRDKKGYVWIHAKGHPRRDRRGYVQEHVLVYEREHNCCLLKSSDVHHKNGIRSDNRPGNLEAMIRIQHTRLTGRETKGFIKLVRSFSWNKFVN